MTITPKGNFILAEFISFAKLMGSSLVIPGVDDEMMHKAGVFRVIAVGPGRYLANGQLIPIDLAKGDEVFVYSIEHVKAMNPTNIYGDKAKVLINADFVIAVVDRTGDEPIIPRPSLLVPTGMKGNGKKEVHA